MLGAVHVHVHHQQPFDSGGTCPCAIWPDVAPSGVTDVTDGSAVELGVKFTASQDGSITGIRFYKVPDNTGTHTGSLWTSSGTLLATGTFTDESTQRLGGAGLLHPGAGHRGNDLRGLVPHRRERTTPTPRTGWRPR